MHSHKRVSYESIYIYLEIICTTSEQKVTKFEMFEQKRLLASHDLGVGIFELANLILLIAFLDRKFGGATGFE